MPDAEDLGFEMLPPDDEGIEPQAEVAAAADAALDDMADSDTAAETEDAPRPFGRTWVFDFERGRFVRQGLAPAEARGTESLTMWCLMAVNSARFAHAVFSDEFGMEHPEEPVGRLPSDELAADYAERVRDALMVHDRIVAVENVEARVDRVEGVLELESFDVVTDDEDVIPFENVQVTIAVED